MSTVITYQEYLALDHSLEEVNGTLIPVAIINNKVYAVKFLKNCEVHLKEVK